ncbi:YtxH domain-containing protein [Hutsoniella sourekii]|uniref:YtxH domain-containing protein n=1 Tax=Hutsoniella sourekii TaxID=87650 RepID=UPI0004B023D4|nr:YtxH domain-containing protein [Hutsoniella sourekii]
MAGFSSGLFWGAVFGGLAGLLNAPRPGYQTRRELKIYIDQTTEDINDFRYKLDNMTQATSRLIQEGSKSVSTLSRDLDDAVRQFKEETEPHISRIQADINQLQDHIEDVKKS